MIRHTPEFDQRIADWLEADPAAAPDDVLSTVVAAIPSIPQARRGLLAPWRFTPMTNFTRAAAGVAIVAIVGVGVLALNLGVGGPGGPVSPPPSSVPTATPMPTPGAPGIAGWTAYTSEVHGFTMGFPDDWSLHEAATRQWQAGDAFPPPGDDLPYADVFVSPGAGDEQVALFVWEMLAGEGVDVDAVPDLTAWAEAFCNDVGGASCDDFTRASVRMCLDAGGDPCRAAILVPAPDAQYAFFMDWGSAMLEGAPDMIRVVVVAREDGHESTARYGGSVELLRSVLSTMDVRAR